MFWRLDFGLARCRRSSPASDWRLIRLGSIKLMALRRFSRLGHAAVVIVLATGLVNTWLVLDMWPLDASSSYKKLLLAKIALVTVMLVWRC